MLEDMLMPNETHHRVEVITGIAGRRYWPAHEKLRIIEESLVPGESVSAVEHDGEEQKAQTASPRTCCSGGAG